MAKAKLKKNKEGVAASAERFDYDLLLKPIVTEKTAGFQVSEQKRIAFRVPRTATKTSIRAAIEKVFGVQVDKINTVNVQGKFMRNVRGVGRRASFKKAYVTLKKGQSIDVVEGI